MMGKSAGEKTLWGIDLGGTKADHDAIYRPTNWNASQ